MGYRNGTSLDLLQHALSRLTCSEPPSLDGGWISPIKSAPPRIHVGSYCLSTK